MIVNHRDIAVAILAVQYADSLSTANHCQVTHYSRLNLWGVNGYPPQLSVINLIFKGIRP
jgi:hypothetical protein